MVNPPSRTPTIFEQLMAAAAHAAMHPELPRKWPLNSFPSGIRPGSATDKTKKALVDAYPRFLEHWQLMEITGCRRGSIAWAVKYLAAHGLLTSVPSFRRPGYRRYRAILEQRHDK